jgi:hypothetical protein
MSDEQTTPQPESPAPAPAAGQTTPAPEAPPPAGEGREALFNRLVWHTNEVARLRKELNIPRPPRRKSDDAEKSIAMTFAYRRGFTAGAITALGAFIAGVGLDELRDWARRLGAWRDSKSIHREPAPRVRPDAGWPSAPERFKDKKVLAEARAAAEKADKAKPAPAAEGA